MNKYLSLTVLIILGACQPTTPENTASEETPFPDKGLELESNNLQATAKDDFSDLEKKDESCDTEEDLEKKIEDQARKKQAFQLQGGDEGCVVE